MLRSPGRDPAAQPKERPRMSSQPIIVPDGNSACNGREQAAAPPARQEQRAAGAAKTPPATKTPASTANAAAAAARPESEDLQAPALVATDSEWDTNCAPKWL